MKVVTKQIAKKIEDKLVIKNNRLVEFRGRLTRNELQLFSLIMANVHENESNLTEERLLEYKIDVKELKGDLKGHDFHGYLKQVAFGLEEKSVVVDYKENGYKKSAKLRLINSPVVSGGEGTLAFYLNKELIPYILEFKKQGYTQYQFVNILKMRSSYSVRIYELIKQYQNYKDGSREFKISDLRAILGLEDTEYTSFKDFNKRVLKKAKEEINKFTDIAIEYEYRRKNRRVVGVKIVVLKSITQENRKKQKIVQGLYDIKELEKKMGLVHEKFNPTKILKIYEIACNKTQGEELDPYRYVTINYMWVISKSEEISNIYGYLVKTLDEDLGRARATMKMEAYFNKQIEEGKEVNFDVPLCGE